MELHSIPLCEMKSNHYILEHFRSHHSTFGDTLFK